MNTVRVFSCLKPGARLPVYKSSQAAGADVSAFLENQITIMPGERLSVATGVSIALPEGYEAQIRPRSGLALEYGITCLNSPGTIDSDYRGEIKVILINHGSIPFTVKDGDRIAQLIISPVSKADFFLCDSLDSTARGISGFGSTGT